MTQRAIGGFHFDSTAWMVKLPQTAPVARPTPLDHPESPSMPRAHLAHSLRWTVSLGAAILSLACGGAPRPAANGAAGPAADAPSLPAPGAFHTEGLDAYVTDTRLPASADEQQLSADVQRSLAAPPALDCLAREYAARFAADGADPDPGTVQALAWRCGYWTRPVRPLSITAPDLKSIIAKLRTLPPQALEGTIGIGVVRHPDGKVTATVLHDPGEIRLDQAVARLDTPGQPATLSGRLLKGDGRLELWITDGEGPQRIEVQTDPTGKFKATLPAASGPRRVELARKLGRFRRTVALMRLGEAAPATYAAPRAAPATFDKQAIAAGLVEAINARRARGKLPPLVHEVRLDPALDDYIGRIAERTAPDAPPGMLDERGWAYARLRYAVTEGRDATQAIDLLVAAPTGERAVLTDAVDRVAVGVRAFDNGRGFDAVFAAVQRFDARPAAELRPALLEVLNTARGKDGHPALAAAPSLDAIAQEAAEDALAGRLEWKAVVPGVMDAIRTGRLVRGGFGAGAFPTVTIGEAPIEQEPNAMEGTMKYVGFGVAGGPLPGGGAPRYLIVYVVAESLPPTDG